MKRILSITLAAIMILSMNISVAAAFLVGSGQSKTITLDSDNRFKEEWSIDVSESGTLKLDVTTYSSVSIKVYKNGSIPVETSKTTKEAGFLTESSDPSYTAYLSRQNQRAGVGTFEYLVTKGNYIIVFSNAGGGNSNVTFTYPQEEKESATEKSSATKTTSPIMTINLKKGSSMQLGAEFPSNAKIAWETSKKSVATVSSSGKVTAVTAGSATIKATSGNKSVKIKIKVS